MRSTLCASSVGKKNRQRGVEKGNYHCYITGNFKKVIQANQIFHCHLKSFSLKLATWYNFLNDQWSIEPYLYQIDIMMISNLLVRFLNRDEYFADDVIWCH